LIKGYNPTPSEGTATLTSLDRARRVRRAVAALGTALLAALVSIFIPVAYFLLVPTFVLTGVVLFVVRLKMSTQAILVQDTCPDCGNTQDFDANGPWRLPQQLNCRLCHRTLTATSTNET
jgi:hypothetical protein